MRSDGTARRGITRILIPAVLCVCAASPCGATPVYGPVPAALPVVEALASAPADGPASLDESRMPLGPGSGGAGARSRLPAAEGEGAEEDGAGLWGIPAGSIGQSIGALSLVIGLIVTLATVGRRLARLNPSLASAMGAGGRAPSGVLEVLGRFPVGRGETLVLLRADRRVLLLSHRRGGRLGAGGFTTLSEFHDPDDVASLILKTRDPEDEAASRRFTEMLDAADRPHRVKAGPVGSVGRANMPTVEAHPAWTEAPSVGSIRARLGRLRAAGGAP